MASRNTFYLTTTLPYVNAKPHIGFALEITEGDVICRYQRLQGKDVAFNTGTDEHGQKIYELAQKNNQEPQDYVNEYAVKFDDLKQLLNLSYTHFIRTTNPSHKKAAQEFWRRCHENGDIYKKNYKLKYCVGCELEKTDSELENGRCPLHPNDELEIRQEENYFFRFSKYQQALLDLYERETSFVHPPAKLKEIKSFVKSGLIDFSISRLKEKMPWGVAVPGDPDHVMYVWFDALVNYISTIGWPSDMESFNKYWPGIQLAGKDNLRQQSAMWQAMLMSAGVESSRQILINGFIGVDGQKMSKSLGNVISPEQLVGRYGLDGARFQLLMLGSFGEDMDVTWERMDQTYSAHLANGLGNLCSRVSKLVKKNGEQVKNNHKFDSEFEQLFDQHKLTQALELVINWVSETDQFLSQTKPWEKQGQDRQQIVSQATEKILVIAHHLQPFMPETAQAILDHFTQKQVKPLAPLFPRLS